MKKFYFFIPFLLLCSLSILAQPISGDKIIKAAGGDYPTLAAALAAVNANGVTGTVKLLIDEDLAEDGSDLYISRTDFSALNNLVIKPNTGKTPTITITGCDTSNTVGTQVDTAKRQAGFTLLNTSYVTIDGSNTVGGTTRDLTFMLNDIYNGVQFINLFGNCDYNVIKNINVKYAAISTSTSTRGIYCNGQWSGVVDSLIVMNNQVGDGLVDPYYAVSVTGSSVGSRNASSVYIKSNLLYGKMRPVYFFRGGTAATTSEIADNTIININPPASGNVVWGILFNTYDGTFNIYGNKLNTQRSVTSGTNGVYGIGTLTGAAGVHMNIYNNFLGGDIEHTGTGIPASIDIISFQDNIADANVYYNTIVLNNVTATASGRMTGIRFGGTANVDVKNNIIICNKDAATVYAIYNGGGTYSSNYNNLYVSGTLANVGYSTTARKTLADWITATTQDSNSSSKAVNFTSATDFHLTGASIGDGDLMALPIAGITTDIDGDTRTATPYKGADEAPIPGMQGDYYVGAAGTAPGGTNPHFSTLKAAIDSLNGGDIDGDVNFYITSNLVEPANIGLGVTTPYTVTIKPYTGTVDTILFTQVADNVGASGGFVMGTPDLTITSTNNYGLVTTNNIVIDGSNTVGGTTRDLVFLTNTGINTNTYPVRLIGDVNNVTIKNIKVVTQQSTSYALTLTVRYGAGANFVPDSVTVENCEIINTFGNTAQGLAISNSGTVTAFPTNIIFRNNVITARTRGIFLNNAGNTDIYGNEVSVNQTVTGYMSYGIWGLTIGDTASVTNIYNNKLNLLSTANSNTGDYGIVGIEAGSKGYYNIYNNMITGFAATTVNANPSFKLIGIRSTSASVKSNIMFNTINMNDVTVDPGTGTVTYAGIYISNGTHNVMNNIVVAAEPDFTTYCVYRAGTNGVLNSNYNDYYAATPVANVGFFNATAAPTLTDWQTASTMDANSISANPNFVSPVDLHLVGVNSPVMGKGNAVAWITTDIDGELRDSIPELGADEIPGIIPVELAGFSASVNNGSITLTWETATETNSRYFDVERNTNDTWQSAGVVNAAGTSTERRKYSFTDNNVNAAVVKYRLKIVDMDGTYSYSGEVEVNSALPTVYELSQNYPNPFNPVTNIRYSIPENSTVTLEVFSILGERVETLVNDFQNAGKYTVSFNGSKYASGTYIYRLTANQTVITKKMVLIK